MTDIMSEVIWIVLTNLCASRCGQTYRTSGTHLWYKGSVVWFIIYNKYYYINNKNKLEYYYGD